MIVFILGPKTIYFNLENFKNSNFKNIQLLELCWDPILGTILDLGFGSRLARLCIGPNGQNRVVNGFIPSQELVPKKRIKM